MSASQRRRTTSQGSSSPGRSPVALTAAVWWLLFAGASAYWAAGGGLGSHTIARDLVEQAEARDPSFVAMLWIAAAGKTLLAGLALALGRPIAGRVGRLVRLAGWVAGVAFVLYGAVGLVEFLSMGLGISTTPASVGSRAVPWYIFFWEPVWVIGGLLLVVATRAARPSTVTARTGALGSAGLRGRRRMRSTRPVASSSSPATSTERPSGRSPGWPRTPG
jgi:Protein of unknown function (DUF3995)